MSDETHWVRFSKNILGLEMRFEGDEYGNASVKFKLEAKSRGVLQESPAIPVKSLFDLAYLVDVSVRRNGILAE